MSVHWDSDFSLEAIRKSEHASSGIPYRSVHPKWQPDHNRLNFEFLC